MNLTMSVKTVHTPFQVNPQRSALVIHIPRRCFFVSAHGAPLFYFFDSGFTARTQNRRKEPREGRIGLKSLPSSTSPLTRNSTSLEPSARSAGPPSLPAGQIN